MNLFQKYLFVPTLILFGFGSLFVFQNCSTDVGFEQVPSLEHHENAGEGGVTDGPGGDGGGTGTSGEDSTVRIHVNEEPKDMTQSEGNAVVDFEVIYTGGQATVQCEHNGSVVACDLVDRITISNPPLGPNTFTIVARDANGTPEVETLSWTVYRSIVSVSQHISVDVQSDQVDVIINVDNSGSMLSEQENMANRIQDFISPFSGLDYHIAVTTTSPIGNDEIWKPSLNYVDGKFVPLNPEGDYCIKSSKHSQSQAQTLIRNNVVRGLFLLNDDGSVFKDASGRTRPEGNGWERGIYTTYRAFERAVNNQQGDSSCLRPNVAKHVIVISDERETMTYFDGQANIIREMPDYAKSVGQNLIDYVEDHYGVDTVFKFHSIIVNPDTDEGRQCLQGNGGRYGVEYANLSHLTGGHIGSVCASNYATQLGQIGEQISNSSLTYNLECVAVSNNGNLGRVVIKGTNTEVTEDYGFFGDKVEFGGFLGAGEYTIQYFCYSMD